MIFNELNFGSTDLTWLVAAPLAVVVLSLYAFNRIKAERELVISPANEAILLPATRKSNRRLQISLLVLASALIAAATLRPQYGFQWLEGAVAGSDIVIALDVSQSMLAADIAPSRLARAKREIAAAVDKLQGSRVALLSFAGVSFTESPLTRDYSAFKQLLSTTDEDSVPIPGSNIELAIERAVKLLEGSQQGEATANLRRRTVVVVSDGEELQGSIQAGAELLRKKGIELILFAVGTETGAPVPFRSGDAGTFQPRRERIITRLDRANLTNLAQSVGAESVFLDRNFASDTVDELTKLLIGQNSSKAGTNRARVYTEYYQLPLLLGLLLLTFAWRPAWLAVALLLLLSKTASAADTESLGAQGQRLLEQGKLTEAQQSFEAAATAAPANDPRPLLGLGSALYREGKFDDAAKAFGNAEARAGDGQVKALSIFNKGNALLQAEKVDEAIAAYEQGLKLAPNDREMRQNLEVARKKRKKDSSQKQQNQSKDKQQQQSDDNSNEEANSDSSGEKEENPKQDQQSQDKQQDSGDQTKSENQQSDDGSQSEDKEKDQQSDSDQAKSQDEQKDQNNSAGKDKEQQQHDNQATGDDTKDQETLAGQQPKEDEANTDAEGSEEQQLTAANGTPAAEADQNAQLMKSVSESRNALSKFRAEEGEKILQEKGIPFPHKDW